MQLTSFFKKGTPLCLSDRASDLNSTVSPDEQQGRRTKALSFELLLKLKTEDKCPIKDANEHSIIKGCIKKLIWKSLSKVIAFCFFLVSFLLTPWSAAITPPPENTTIAFEACLVIQIKAADIIRVIRLRDSTFVTVKLHGIECPEKTHAYGKKAKQYTSAIAYGKVVEVRATDKDRHGRTVAWIYIDGKSLNESLIAAGLAWQWRRKNYSPDQLLINAEKNARVAKVGLWSTPSPTPPWAWRRSPKTKNKLNKTAMAEGHTIHGNVNLKEFRSQGCKNCTKGLGSQNDAIVDRPT